MPGTGVNDVVRSGRFDKATFQRRAEERRRAEEDAERERERAREAKRPDRSDRFAPTRQWLEARKSTVDLESKVGKTEIVPGARDKRAGFYCDICQSLHKDSQAYLNHVNSRFHQKNLGMSMRVKRNTVDDVKARLADMKKEAKSEKTEYDFFARVKQLEEDKKREQGEKRSKKSEKATTDSEAAKEEAGDDADAGEDAEMNAMAMMGLPTGFSSSKK